LAGEKWNVAGPLGENKYAPLGSRETREEYRRKLIKTLTK